MLTPEPHSYILLKTTPPCRSGELLELRGDGYHLHTHSVEFPLGPCHPSSDEVAPLTEEECVLLDGIRDCADRYTVYSTPGRLAWGVELKVGDTVLARLPYRSGRGSSADGEQNQYTTAIIRWAGRPDLSTGHKFGVEITVSTMEYTLKNML